MLSMFQDRDSQVEAIEGTFEAAQRPVCHKIIVLHTFVAISNISLNFNQIYRHPSKKGIKPVDVLPVFPDFQVIILLNMLHSGT